MDQRHATLRKWLDEMMADHPEILSRFLDALLASNTDSLSPEERNIARWMAVMWFVEWKEQKDEDAKK